MSMFSFSAFILDKPADFFYETSMILAKAGGERIDFPEI
jgi:hypothetical protein